MTTTIRKMENEPLCLNEKMNEQTRKTENKKFSNKNDTPFIISTLGKKNIYILLNYLTSDG